MHFSESSACETERPLDGKTIKSFKVSMPRKAQKKGDFVTLHPDSENTQKRALQLYGTTTTRGHGNWNAEETYFSTYVPTLNASEGVGNGTTMDNLILNSYRNAHCSSSNSQPSKAMRNGTRKKIIIYNIYNKNI